MSKMTEKILEIYVGRIIRDFSLDLGRYNFVVVNYPLQNPIKNVIKSPT